MSAQFIYDTAPLGSLIRFSNGEPQPLTRFKRKLKSWEQDNRSADKGRHCRQRMRSFGNYRLA